MGRDTGDRLADFPLRRGGQVLVEFLVQQGGLGRVETVMKYCDPLESGPELAMDSTPNPS